MSQMNAMKRSIVAVAIALFLPCALGASEATAAVPWWHVSTLSSPAATAGQESLVTVDVSNLGEGCVDECGLFTKFFGEPYVTFVDTLPAGVTPNSVYLEGSGGISSLAKVFSSCELAGQTATCTYDGPLQGYEQLELILTVSVGPNSGDGINELRISGGGAPSLVTRRPLALESVPRPGVATYELTPEAEGGAPDTQAGSHPLQLTTTLLLPTKAVNVENGLGEGTLTAEPVALTKDLRFKLPPGLVGNPTPLPKCSVRVFLEAKEGRLPGCPNDTVVGEALPIVAGHGSLANAPHAPLALNFPLYDLEPSVGEPARFGFPTPFGGVILDTSVPTGGDYGVVITVPDIVTRAEFIGSRLTFWGVPADPRHNTARGTCLNEYSFNETAHAEKDACTLQSQPQPLLIMPTSCTGHLHTTVQEDSWEEIGQFTGTEYTFANSAGEPYGLDGCNHLGFEPSVNLTPDGQEAAAPTGLTVGVHVPQESALNPQGLADSAVRDTRVTLPAGVVLDASGADGLQACSLAQVGLEVDAEQQCPEASKVGTVEIETPLLPHRLDGAAYLAQQNANPFGSLIAMYIVVKDPYSGVIVKLAGEVKPDPQTGQLTATFDETPQVPFENLRLNFFGGARAPLGTPAFCGAYTTTGSITPWSGNPAVSSASTFEITSGPNHGPCLNPLPFKPQFTAGTTSIQAGGFTPFTMTMSHEDGSQNLDAITLHMPPGLEGTLTGVETCGEPQADLGTCGPASQIGETTISVGLGGSPFTVSGGKVFLTGPYKGAPFGLSIVNPAKAGPFDVERDTSNPAYQNACDCVVVRAKIEVDPTTAALTVTSDTTGPHRIPTILDGIPLEIKHINVTIGRPSFIFNPTNCEPMSIGGYLTSAEGATDRLSAPFQVTNCATLDFEPHFSVSTSAQSSRTSGVSLVAKLTYPNVPYDKRSNVARVRVELPKQLPSRLTTLQKACPDTVFNANPDNCPEASRVGEASATTPIIPEGFRGPAYFVSHGGARFPELIIVLHGYSLTVELHGETFISKAGVTSTTFSTIPDVPIGSFELKLPAGPDSALAANGDLCAQKLVMPTTFTAQNGTMIQEDTPISVQGCRPAIRVVRHKVSGKRATVVVRVPSAGTLVASGRGLSSVRRLVSAAGDVAVTLRLSKEDQRFVAHHHGRRLMAPIRLAFMPHHGKRLTAQVAVLMR